MAKVLASLKYKQKGQGIVEYALLLAFVVALAMFLNTGGGLKDSVVAVFDDVANLLGGYRTYSEYYGDWHSLSYNDLSAQSNKDRIKADQEGLQKLVQNLIGLNKEDALTELKKLMPNAKDTEVNPNGQGDSQVLTLLSTYDHYYDTPNNPYITLGADTQNAAVNYLSDQQATTYKDSSRMKSKDRVFFSDDMINSTSQRTVTAQLHYENGKVASVDVVAHIGNANSTTYAEGLNMSVTGSGKKDYTVK